MDLMEATCIFIVRPYGCLPRVLMMAFVDLGFLRWDFDAIIRVFSFVMAFFVQQVSKMLCQFHFSH